MFDEPVTNCYKKTRAVEKSVYIPKYLRVADTIRTRIIQGSYAIRPIPSERTLALEFGVNYMTARRSLKMLEAEGLLIRHANKRTRVKLVKHGSKSHLNIGFLMPTLSSHALDVWRTGLDKAVHNRPYNIRPLLYMHWNDPILLDALKGFDGVFISPHPQDVPESVAGMLRDPKHSVVVVDHDFSSYGVPSIRIFQPVFIHQLLNHLRSLGHTRIGCFNTQPDNSEVRERIDQWRLWMGIHGFTGRLVNNCVSPGGDASCHAYEIMDKFLTENQSDETAWFFITAPAAIGAMRAIHDHGIMPGKDISICTANGEGFLAAMSYPRLTALESSDPVPFITYCLNWISKGHRAWEGPLLMQPAEVPLVIGESTQPVSVRTSLLPTENQLAASRDI